ncbi:MAG: hypothetical protein ABSH01_08170 [Terriglobia bacterium]
MADKKKKDLLARVKDSYAREIRKYILSKPRAPLADCRLLTGLVLDMASRRALLGMKRDGSMMLPMPSGLRGKSFIFNWILTTGRYSFVGLDDRIMAVRVE